MFCLAHSNKNPAWSLSVPLLMLLLSMSAHCVTSGALRKNGSPQDGAKLLIVPATRVGTVRLGMSKDDFLRLFPLKSRYDMDVHHGVQKSAYVPKKMCPDEEIDWLDPTNYQLLIVLFTGNRISQIKVMDPRYATESGIRPGDSPKKIQVSYSSVSSYLLKYSGSKVNGGRDLIYWASKDGIAFELAYDSEIKVRVIRSISIFDPAAPFEPEGCVAQPQKWIRLKPFTSTVPSRTGSK